MSVKVKIKLHDVRKCKSLTIKQLAELSGVSKSHIAAIEAGQHVPSIYVLCCLAAAMEMKPEELYTYEVKK